MNRYEDTHLPYTITGEFNRLAFDLVHAPENRELYTTACDKLTAKDYVSQQVGQEYVADLFGVSCCYDILHGFVESENYMIKHSLNSGRNSAVLNGEIQRPWDLEFDEGECWYFWEDRKPGVFFAEELLGKEMHTYKFFFYKGEILSVYYYYENTGDDSISIRTMVSYPDLQPTGWIDRYKIKGEFRHSKNWDEIVWLAKKLAVPFPIVRMDIFDTENGVFFSEFTATFRAFTMSEESDKALMDLINRR